MFSQEYGLQHGRPGSSGLVGALFRVGSSWSRLSAPSKTILTAGALAAASAAAWWLLQWIPIDDEAEIADTVPIAAPRPELDSATLHAVLDELMRRFFHITREVAIVARDLRERIKAGGHEITDDAALQGEIARQCQVAMRFAKIREDILTERGISEDAMARLSEADAKTLEGHAEGVGKMLTEALQGTPPSLPGLQIPAELTEKRLLEVRAEMMRLKLQKVGQLAAATQGKRYSAEELGRAAAAISQAAEEEIFEARHELLGKEGEIYHSAVALCQKSASFARRVTELDAEHRRALVAAFRAGQSSAS